VVDSDDRHAGVVAVDLVDHAEVTASRAVLSPEADPQRWAYLVGVVRQAAVDELDARCGDRLRSRSSDRSARDAQLTSYGSRVASVLR
jgi:hypothetical protein